MQNESTHYEHHIVYVFTTFYAFIYKSANAFQNTQFQVFFFHSIDDIYIHIISMTIVKKVISYTHAYNNTNIYIYIHFINPNTYVNKSFFFVHLHLAINQKNREGIIKYCRI